MASAPRRRWSKEIPPDLSDLMNKLIEYAAAFIGGFYLRESEMRRIVREFQEISDEVRQNFWNFWRITAKFRIARQAENLGRDFRKTVEPLKDILEEIKTTCEKLELKSAEVQAENTLSDMEEFHMILKRVSKLKDTSEGIRFVVLDVLAFIGNLLVLIARIIIATVSPERDREFTQSIIQSADQCQKVFDNFDEMKKELKSFIETKE